MTIRAALVRGRRATTSEHIPGAGPAKGGRAEQTRTAGACAPAVLSDPPRLRAAASIIAVVFGVTVVGRVGDLHHAGGPAAGIRLVHLNDVLVVAHDAQDDAGAFLLEAHSILCGLADAGTILLGFLLYRLGVDIQFKISVFFGSDNPYHALWIMMMAKLFSREDGTSPLIGFNWSNSINNQTMELTADFRKTLGFEHVVRFEHHITETWKSIVKQPYDRRAELVQVADHVANISAKHEGGDPEIEPALAHPSDILDYFGEKKEVCESGDWENLQQNFLNKVEACNHTAHDLTKAGLSFVAAKNLHK